MKVLITAGPTREPIDSVRYISNRSSGRMGIELTNAACAAGHEVTLLLGPVCMDEPTGCNIHKFESVNSLKTLLDKHFPYCDLLIMVSAVSDYQVKMEKKGKLKRENSGELNLTLTPTVDIVAGAVEKKSKGQFILAFALEDAQNKDELKSLGAKKLKRKNVDAIVVNPLPTMDSKETEPLLITADGIYNQPQVNLEGKISKKEFAQWLIKEIESLKSNTDIV